MTLLAVTLFSVLVALGFWQLDRARQKAELQAVHATRGGDDPILLESYPGGARELAHRRVQVQGRYRAERQVFRDNRTHEGRAGYHVITPLEPSAGGPLVLVNRGWVPWGQTREVLPDAPAPAGEVTVRGTVHLPSERTLVLGPEEAHGGAWPRVVQAVDPPALGEALGAPVRPLVVRLDPEAPGGFVRDWRPYYGIGPAKHRAYALQWFSFAVILLVGYAALSRREADTP